MSKALPSKKKVTGQTSTDSSSGSSSDSSSTSSSSSGSGSSSSSDSDSSSDSSPKHSSTEQKKSATTQKTPSAPKTSSSQKTANVQKTQRKSTENKPTEKKSQKPPSKPKPLESSDDEEKPPVVKPKKKTQVKPKSSATVTAKTSTNTQSGKVSSGGGKVPPKANPAAKIQQHNKQKEKEDNSKKKDSTGSQNGNDPNKKKSIFSPENSSESENNDTTKNTKAQAIKNTAPKPRSKASVKPKPVAKKEKVIKSKELISSASSASSSSESSSSSDSDSDSSTEKMEKKKNQPENEKKITRKLTTRSSNTRKSKHVLGKNVYTDTDSDTESTKRSQSRSPVKRAPVSTKGKSKNKKNDAKNRSADILITEERKCPLEGCNSLGHLGGRQEKHFTVDACPMYHNLTANDCKENLGDRKKREEGRKKIIENNKKSPKSQPNPEQKTYLQRIRESRAKFKFDLSEEGKVVVDKNKEPVMDSFVPEYDLKLFRDAQAIASEKIEEELKTQPNTKGTKYIEMGKFEMEVWYQSPYPEEFARLPKLYICEYCLRYMRGRTVLERHAAKCVWRHPPGEEVYRKDKISVWEVDGKRYKQYCQNLCLLAKFFLDHKTLYYDVEPFLFYVMTMLDSEGCHTVGYFSKEKNSFLNYNVSCILTLPPYQRQGYGRLLIDFSYLLTRVEGKIGSPEKPLSDLGLISYRSYWKDVLLGYLCSRAGTQLSVKDISQEMAIHSTDIVSTLQALGMMKYWKGKHIILKKQDVLDEYVDRVKRRGSLLKEVDPECLRWTPFVPPQPNPS